MEPRGRLFFLFLFIPFLCSAAGELVVTGGRAAAMGYTSVAVSDGWSGFNNPAGLVWNKTFCLGLYLDNRFLVKEMSYKALGVSIPFKRGALGIIVAQYGYSLYNEVKGGICYSMRLGKKLSGGVLIDYLRLNQGTDNSTKNLFSFEAGVQFRASKNLSIGIHASNPVPIKISQNSSEALPILLRFGLSWQITDSFLASLELEENNVWKTVFKSGIEYYVVKSVCMRVGFLSNPMQFTFGAGIQFWKLQFDIASSYHPVLGYSPQGSIQYLFK
jgi:hypothetical protein